jgi:hypothetical protein
MQAPPTGRRAVHTKIPVWRRSGSAGRSEPLSIAIAPRMPLRVAVLGTGTMGRHHLQAITRLPNAAVVALADQTTTSTPERRAL